MGYYDPQGTNLAEMAEEAKLEVFRAEEEARRYVGRPGPGWTGDPVLTSARWAEVRTLAQRWASVEEALAASAAKMASHWEERERKEVNKKRTLSYAAWAAEERVKERSALQRAEEARSHIPA